MKEEPDVLIEAELATASASSQNLRAPSPLGAAADTMDGGTGNLGNPIPEGDRQSAKVAFITDPPAVVVPISESHHEPRAGDGSHSAESGTPVRDDGRDDSMASQFETKNTVRIPIGCSHHVVCQVSEGIKC